MISCPDERELLELVDGDLAEDRADDVVDHLGCCEECRLALGRSEAALLYALGGLADTGRWSATPTPSVPAATDGNVDEPDAAEQPERRPLLRLAVPALAAAAAMLVGALALLTDGSPAPTRPDDLVGAAPRPETELRGLLARAEALRDTSPTAPDSRDLVAAGALAAAEARIWTLGPEAARARMQDVVERFPGTAAAREARALLASPTWTEDVR